MPKTVWFPLLRFNVFILRDKVSNAPSLSCYANHSGCVILIRIDLVIIYLIRFSMLHCRSHFYFNNLSNVHRSISLLRRRQCKQNHSAYVAERFDNRFNQIIKVKIEVTSRRIHNEWFCLDLCHWIFSLSISFLSILLSLVIKCWWLLLNAMRQTKVEPDHLDFITTASDIIQLFDYCRKHDWKQVFQTSMNHFD